MADIGYSTCTTTGQQSTETKSRDSGAGLLCSNPSSTTTNHVAVSEPPNPLLTLFTYYRTRVTTYRFKD